MKTPSTLTSNNIFNRSWKTAALALSLLVSTTACNEKKAPQPPASVQVTPPTTVPTVPTVPSYVGRYQVKSATVTSQIDVPAKGDRKQLTIAANTEKNQTFLTYVFSSFISCSDKDFANAALELRADGKVYFVCLADDGSVAGDEVPTGSYEGSDDGSALKITLSNDNITFAGHDNIVLNISNLKRSDSALSGAVKGARLPFWILNHGMFPKEFNDQIALLNPDDPNNEIIDGIDFGVVFTKTAAGI